MGERDIGNLFVVGFHVTRLTPNLREFLEELRPSGVILFSRNIEDPIQLAELNRDLQVHARQWRDDGLLIIVDQEGGRVRRLQEPFSAFPCAMELARSDRPDDLVREFARVTAREIKLVGFKVDFVPVLDVVAQQDNLDASVIGDRAFGFDPGDVARLGRIVIETMRSEGVIPCCKHFPGHGGTLVDSHVDLPVDDRQPEDLETRDLVPFLEAFKAHVEMTLTAHVLYPELDRDLPATLSGEIVGNWLRRRMGFEGVVITDDLDMGAIEKRYSPEESSLLACAAGADLLMFCNHPVKALAAKARLVEALRSGELESGRVSEALSRVRRLKADYRAAMEPCDPARVQQFVSSREEESGRPFL